MAELGLGHRVIFTGYRDRDLPQVLAAGDCFALMAAGSDESCRAALEAMAAARPVVARRVGALPETVVDGETGLLVDGERPEDVAAALAHDARRPGPARAMGEAGRRRAETEFSPERSVTIVERVYRDLLLRRRSARAAGRDRRARSAGAPGSAAVKLLQLVSCRGWSSDAYWAARASRELAAPRSRP